MNCELLHYLMLMDFFQDGSNLARRKLCCLFVRLTKKYTILGKVCESECHDRHQIVSLHYLLDFFKYEIMDCLAKATFFAHMIKLVYAQPHPSCPKVVAFCTPLLRQFQDS